jgi:lipopolysaccharide export system protein LptA
MKPPLIFCIALLASGAGLLAQGPSGQRPLLDFRKKKVDESTKAKAVDAAKTIIQAIPDDLKDKTKALLTAPETAEMRSKAMQAAQTLIQSNSAATTPTQPSPGTPVVETPPPPAGPQPQPLQPLNLDEAPKASKGQIVITARKSAFFDANRGYGIYVGDVRARHPQMYIECEELELYMAKQEGGVLGDSKPKPAPAAPAAKDSDILAQPSKKSGAQGGNIDKADARGPMVLIEKMSAEGELQVGHCKHLIYDGKTGNSTLLDWPQVQAGNKLHKATEPGCVMVIDQKGLLTTTGGHQTIILQGQDATPKSRSGMAPAPQ